MIWMKIVKQQMKQGRNDKMDGMEKKIDAIKVCIQE